MVVDGASVYLGNANGLIVKAPGEPTLWHMGDTDIFSDMALIAEIHRPDIVILRSATASPWGGNRRRGGDALSRRADHHSRSLRHLRPAEPNADRFVSLVGEEATVVVPPLGVAHDFPKP